MTKVKIKAKLPTDSELKKMFASVDALKRHGVTDQAVRAGAAPIRKRFRQLVPRGSEFNEKKRSRKQASQARWHLKTKDHISLVIRKYKDGGAAAFVGPKWPVGNKLYFNYEWKRKNRRVFYWGKDSGTSMIKRRNIAIQAAEETRTEQLSAMKRKTKMLLDKMMG